MDTRRNGLLSPQASIAQVKRGSVSPLRMNNPAKQGIRIVESGEMRVVNKAAKHHWDYARDNQQQLKQLIHDMRFENAPIDKASRNKQYTTTETSFETNQQALLVKIGLTQLNNPSMERLPHTSAGYEDKIQQASIFEHNIREGAPRNALAPTGDKAAQVITQYVTQDGNFGASKNIQIASPTGTQNFVYSVDERKGQQLEDYGEQIQGYFTIGRKSSGEIFEKLNRSSKSVIQSNFSRQNLGKPRQVGEMKLELSQASFGKTLRSMHSSKNSFGLPGTSTMTYLQRPQGQSAINTKISKSNLLNDSKSALFDVKRQQKSSMDKQQPVQAITISEDPSYVSRKEYLRNRKAKITNIVDVKPEMAGMVDRRELENSFNGASMHNKSLSIARDAKAMRLNRRQMFKNAPLEDSYEPVITTKQVTTPLRPEIDLPALKQTYKNTLGGTSRMDEPLDIITHGSRPKYQKYLTQENENGVKVTNAQQHSFRRKSMVSCFVDKEHSAKNHREFHAAQQQKPVGLYALPAGQFSQAAGKKTGYSSITRSQLGSLNIQSPMLGRSTMIH